MPPPRPQRFAVGDVDWAAVRAKALTAAESVGLATRRSADTDAPPLFPGLKAPSFPSWSTPNGADGNGSGPDGHDDRTGLAPAPLFPTAAPPRPPAVEHSAVTRAVVRLGVLSVGTVLGALVVLGVAAVLTRPAMSNAKALVDVELDIPEEASLPALDERSVVTDADGNLLAVIDREVSRRSIPLDRIPDHVKQAVITAEDRKFYEHEGYDVEGIARALWANVQARDVREGGSTITQQLAKSEVGNERTLERKSAELLYAMALEERFSKEELLERYLNQVYFGSRAYGVAAAAEEFFHTTPGKLKVHHAALLASMIRSPNSADPRDEPQLALQRRNAVLRGMVEEGYIDAERLPRLVERPLGVKESSPKRRRRQPHVVDAVERELLRMKAFGKNREQRERLLYYGGLRITTTLDLKMQRTATSVIRDFTSGAPTAAIATVDPATGEIKAIASGLGYKKLKYDLPTQGRRQPGSAMKPFVYAAALQDGFPLEMRLTGRSPTYFEGVPGWEKDCSEQDKKVCGVSNYGGASYGDLTMPDALKNSVNTAAAQLTITLGAKRVAKQARQMNINIKAATNGKITQSIGLGGLDQGVTPLEMASAYGVFANEGKRVRPHLITRVEDRSGKVIYQAKPKTKQVIDPVVDAVMVDMMKGVVTGGTGTGAALPSWEVAGKTGTTSSNVDAWFVGYTPVLSTAVWVGHAKGQVEMPGMTGGSLPASIWRTYMAKVLEGRKVVRFPEPDFDALRRRMTDQQVTVPDVVRMTEGEALAALGKRKLIGEIRDEYSSAPEGTVVWQSPAPGGSASPGDTVYIGVSTGYVPPPPSSSSGGGGGSGSKKKQKEQQKEEQKAEEDTGTTEEDTSSDTTDGGGDTSDGGGGGGDTSDEDTTDKPGNGAGGGG